MPEIGHDFGDHETGARRPDPPRGTEAFVVARNEITVAVNEARLKDDDIPLPSDAEAGEVVIYDQGEEVPEKLAREMFPSFHDRLIPIDENGDRIGHGDDEETEEDKALAKYRRM